MKKLHVQNSLVLNQNIHDNEQFQLDPNSEMSDFQRFIASSQSELSIFQPSSPTRPIPLHNVARFLAHLDENQHAPFLLSVE